MARLRRILWPALLVAAILLLPLRYALAGLGSAGVHLGSLEVCSPLVTIYTFIKN